MRNFTCCLVAGLALALPGAAFAQSDTADSRYCSVLSDDYERYAAAGEEHRGYRAPAPNVAVAMTECESNPAAAIAVLKKALTDAKIPLPPRS